VTSAEPPTLSATTDVALAKSVANRPLALSSTLPWVPWMILTVLPARILLATLAPPDKRHRAIAVSRVAGNAGIGIGGALGGLVAATGLTGFVVLFLANAVSYAGRSPRRPRGSGRRSTAARRARRPQDGRWESC
jgi:predicted MFS family arabinose efflux permease